MQGRQSASRGTAGRSRCTGRAARSARRGWPSRGSSSMRAESVGHELDEARAHGLLEQACRIAGLNADGARLMRIGSNAVYHLAAPVVVRISRNTGDLEPGTPHGRGRKMAGESQLPSRPGDRRRPADRNRRARSYLLAGCIRGRTAIRHCRRGRGGPGRAT